MANLQEAPICSSCSFRNVPVARFCGGCGCRLTHSASQTAPPTDPHVRQTVVGSGAASQGPASADTAATDQSSLSHVNDIHISDRQNPAPAADATPDSVDVIVSVVRPALSAIQVALSERAVLLLALGAIIVGLGQMGLYFSVELNTKAPMGYLFLLTVGVLAFAMGSAGLWLRRSSSPISYNSPALKGFPTTPLASLRSPLGYVGLAIGILGLAFLMVMLAAGTESGSAITIWIMVLAAFALPFFPLAGVATWNVRTRLRMWLRQHAWDLLIVLALIAAFLAINLKDLQAWYYSAIGDEYLFYDHAKRIIDEGIIRPFSQEGVYNKHPVMNSIFQAGVMRIIGADYLGWRFSETLNAALSIPAIYLLGHLLGGRRAAVMAAAVFASSHYVFAFAHTGYNNLSPLPIATWAMAIFVLGWRNGNPLLMYLAGMIAGLGFYTHYSGRAVLPIILLFSLTVGGLRRLVHLWPLALGFALAVIPTFVVEQEAVLTRMFGQVVGGYTEAVTGSAGQRVLENALFNLPAFSYNATVHTYAYGPLLDPFSGFLAVLGIGFALGHVKETGWRLLLTWLGVAMFMTGILSPYPHVAVTRLMFALPPLALLAGLLAGRFWDGGLIRQLKIPEHLRAVAGASVLAAVLSVILVLNLWQFWQVTPSVFPHSQEAVALGAFRSEACGSNLRQTLFVGNGVGDGSLLQQMMSSMDPGGPTPLGIDHADLAQTTALPEPFPGCVVFVNPDANDALRLQEELTRRYPDGQLLAFTNPSGTTTVELFVRN